MFQKDPNEAGVWGGAGPGERVALATRALLGVASALPTLEGLATELEDARRAAARGYFLPDEDARVRAAFSRYLKVRLALFETIGEMRPLVPPRWAGRAAARPDGLRAFVVALTAACMLVRAARFVVDHFAGDDVVWQKLDEAEPALGLARKQFTTVFRSLARPVHRLQFAGALRFADQHAGEIAGLRRDPNMVPVLDLLAVERGLVPSADPAYEVRDWLRFFRFSVRRGGRSGLRQVLFSLFEVSGRAVAEVRNPFHRKRVTPTVRRRLARLLRPGDVIVTRHDDAMSNIFLPGFWPHGALYIGTAAQRRAAGVAPHPDADAPGICTLEAKKDGVRFRTLEETLAVDACCVVRPRLAGEAVVEAVGRAYRHAGKLYDFEFDFTRSDKLVCTELVYRVYHGVGPVAFELGRRAGRLCLTAEAILDAALDGGAFEPVAVFGTRGRNFETGEAARAVLEESYRGAGRAGGGK